MKRNEYEHYRKKQLKNEAKSAQKEPKKVTVSFIIFQVVLIAVFAAILSYAIIQTKKGSKDTANSVDNSNQTPAEAISGSRGVEDVLLFGVKKGDTSGGHTRDYLMICHIDYDKKAAKLATIYRDTLMNIENTGDARIMNAYAIDGPQLVLDTVNRNLDLNISRYAVIYYDDKDTLQQIYDAALEKDSATVASLTNDMLDTMDSNTNSEHERKWVGALGNFDITASSAFPEHFYGGEVDGAWVEVPVTLSDMATDMRAFLYDEAAFTVSPTVKEISERFQSIADTANDDLSGAP